MLNEISNIILGNLGTTRKKKIFIGVYGNISVNFVFCSFCLKPRKRFWDTMKCLLAGFLTFIRGYIFKKHRVCI